MTRETRVAGAVLAVAVAACGDTFVAAVDGGTMPDLDGASDASDASTEASLDTGLLDAAGKDVASPSDAELRDAPKDQGVTPGDGGGLDASLCIKTCPSGFDCIASACVDRAAEHFGAAAVTDNWSYGSFASFGSTPFVPYTASWTTNGIVFASQTKNVLTSSVFHSITSASYEGMSLAAGTLGLYPGALTSIDSVVRWTAPAAGSYTILATFTGLGTMPPTTVGVSVNIGPANEIGMTIDGAMPSITYASAAQTMAAGDTVDFYVNFVTLSEDEQGGTGLDARITAN